jgi:hypothetical protein
MDCKGDPDLDILTTYCFQDDDYESPDVASCRGHSNRGLIEKIMPNVWIVRTTSKRD